VSKIQKTKWSTGDQGSGEGARRQDRGLTVNKRDKYKRLGEKTLRAALLANGTLVREGKEVQWVGGKNNVGRGSIGRLLTEEIQRPGGETTRQSKRVKKGSEKTTLRFKAKGLESRGQRPHLWNKEKKRATRHLREGVKNATSRD